MFLEILLPAFQRFYFDDILSVHLTETKTHTIMYQYYRYNACYGLQLVISPIYDHDHVVENNIQWPIPISV